MKTASPIVDQARTWLGTPFHHQARLKGKGCDCLGLVVGVADELELVNAYGIHLSWYDEIDYPKAPDGAYLLAKLQALLIEVPKDQARPGDLGLFNIQNNPQHLAIFTNFSLADGHYFAFLRFFFGSVGNDDPALALFFFLDAFDDHSIL